jgi:hypothetical protein
MQTSYGHAGYEVLTAVVMDSSDLYLLHEGFLLDLFFDLEDGGNMFFQIVG